MKLEDLVEFCSERVHEANKKLCEANGDNSQVPWGEATPEIQEATRSGVNKVLSDPSLTPSDIHDNWAKDKKAQGYVYGVKKDNQKKTHPSLVAFDKLPKAEQEKDTVYIETCQKAALEYLAQHTKTASTPSYDYR